MLTAQQLYEDLPDVHAYFSDFGAREVAKRGFCIKQLAGNVSLPGVPFWVDPDRIMADNEGGYPMWMIKDTKEAA